MKLFGLEISRSRSDAEQRSLQNWVTTMRHIFGPRKTQSGVMMSEEASMRLSAVYACVRVISGTISSMPYRVYRRTADGGRKVATDHPLYRVLHHHPNRLMSGMLWREVVMVHLLLWGNHYSMIQRNRSGHVVALWPIHPNRVTVELDNEGPGGEPRRIYRIDNSTRTLKQDEVLHIAGMGFDGYIGRSPIQMHRETLGIQAAAEQYTANFYANDASSGLILSTEQPLSDQIIDRLREDWKQYQGPDNSWKIKILEAGLKLGRVTLPPGDSKYIEAMAEGRTAVCGMFGVPPHLIGDVERSTSWGTGIEQQSLGLVIYTLRTWLERIEQAVDMQLLHPGEYEKIYTEHSIEGLLRGDLAARQQWYAAGRQWGWFSVNDIRRLENMEPIDGGEAYLQPINMIEAGTDPFAGRWDRGQRALPPAPEVRAVPERVREAQAFEQLFLRDYQRIIQQEISQIRIAIAEHLGQGNYDAFRNWLVEEFAAKAAPWAQEQLIGAFRVMADAMLDAAEEELGVEILEGELGDFILDYVSGAAERHVGSTVGQMLSMLDDGATEEDLEQRLEEWDERRAEKDADIETVRSSNAFTQAAWLLAGVATVRWALNAGACEFCRQFEGREIQIGGAFADAGQVVAGSGSDSLVVSRKTTHPPLHPFCHCFLQPGRRLRSRRPEAEIRAILADLASVGSDVEYRGHVCGEDCDHAMPSELGERDGLQRIGELIGHPSALDRRDAEIREAYPELRDQMGYVQAYTELADRYHISESQIKRILRQRRRT